MSFAVVHMQKFKVAAVKGIQFHNQRERDSKTNPDIDKSKTNLNYDLHNSKPIDYNQTVKTVISENVITDRAIRKDAVVMCNFVVTSDKNFFDNLTDQEQSKFFEKSYDFFKNRYGEEKIISANVHLDETTPHMHLSLVPVTENNRLSAKSLFDRKELRSIQDDFPKYIQEQGFDLKRGIDAEGKNKHIETQKFKAMEIENKIKDLEQEKNSVQNGLKSIRNDFKEIEGTKILFDEINSIEGKYGFMSKKKITIDINDFEKLKDIAKKQYLLENKIERLERINQDMKSDVNEFSEFKNKSYNKINNQSEKIKKLEQNIDAYKKEYKYLVNYLDEIGEIDKVKVYIKEKREMDQAKEKMMKKQKEWDLER